MNLLYNKNSIIGRFYFYFSMYFKNFSAPAAESLFLFLLSILALESADSLRFLYRHFLSGITRKSLNAFYYLCSHARVDYSSFMNITARAALNLIPEKLLQQPVFLCIDDTMVTKFGKKFEDVSKLFDHAVHHGCAYLNGHCFVSLMLCVPVWTGTHIHYLSVPLGYRIWQKTVSKLALAADMVIQVMPELASRRNVILLCDSWYAKKEVLCLAEQFQNLDIICSVRKDTVLYDLPPAPSGKPGRPPKRRKKLSVDTDFALSDKKTGNYHAAYRMVLSNLFGDCRILAYVTSPDKKSGSRRLFLSTVSPAHLSLFCAWQEEAPLNQTGSDWMMYIPLFLYRFRWNIEVSYYEQKKFWSLERYMLRSRKGIEMMVNLINVAYCSMKILPYMDDAFSEYRKESVQEFRFFVSGKIREQVFIASFINSCENNIKSNTVMNLLKRKVFGFHSCTQKL